MSMNGLLVKGIGGFYYAMADDENIYTLHAQSKFRRERIKPLVGDRVEFEPGRNGDDGWITSILPRKNTLVRPPVSNIDVLVITVSAGVPEADLLLADRMMAAAGLKGIQTIVAVNKCDGNEVGAKKIADEYETSGSRVFVLSAKTGEGIDELKLALKGKTHAFAGQSGVGKSSLINALYGTELEVGRISEKIDRGKHTTRACSLIPVNGGAVLDTPGFSLLETDMLKPEKLKDLYAEFAECEANCFFKPCLHDREPNCAVKERLEAGKIPLGRYERYIVLLNELKERWSKRYD